MAKAFDINIPSTVVSCWYNFVKMHKTVGCTPAMAAKVTDRLWDMNDLVAMVEKFDDAQPRQKPGRKPRAP